MEKTATIRIETDTETMENVESLYSKLGVSLSDAVNLFFRKSIVHDGFPFDEPVLNFNAETLAAIQEVEDMKQNPEKYKGFKNVADLFEELEKDDEV